MTMLTVGVTGPIGHGKTTFATALSKQVNTFAHFESSHIISEVANALLAQTGAVPRPGDLTAINKWLRRLPPIIGKKLHADVGFERIKITAPALRAAPLEYQKLLIYLANLQKDPDLARQKITDRNKSAHRPLLQWLGGYLVSKADKGIWYKEIARRVRGEADKGTELCVVGGLRYLSDAAILRTTGAIIVKIYRPSLAPADITDPTEREREQVPVDSTVLNDGSVDNLATCAEILLRDMQNNRLQPNYSAQALAAFSSNSK